jgi:hypothetical protein
MGPGPRDEKTSRKESANLGASLPRPTQASDSESKFKLPGGAKARRMPLGTLEVPCGAVPLRGPWPGGPVLWGFRFSGGAGARSNGGREGSELGHMGLGLWVPKPHKGPGVTIPRPLRFLVSTLQGF